MLTVDILEMVEYDIERASQETWSKNWTEKLL